MPDLGVTRTRTTSWSMKKFEQLTITGKLPHRLVEVYRGGGKSKCVTCESNSAGIGQFKANEFIMEYVDEAVSSRNV